MHQKLSLRVVIQAVGGHSLAQCIIVLFRNTVLYLLLRARWCAGALVLQQIIRTVATKEKKRHLEQRVCLVEHGVFLGQAHNVFVNVRQSKVVLHDLRRHGHRFLQKKEVRCVRL